MSLVLSHYCNIWFAPNDGSFVPRCFVIQTFCDGKEASWQKTNSDVELRRVFVGLLLVPDLFLSTSMTDCGHSSQVCHTQSDEWNSTLSKYVGVYNLVPREDSKQHAPDVSSQSIPRYIHTCETTARQTWIRYWAPVCSLSACYSIIVWECIRVR